MPTAEQWTSRVKGRFGELAESALKVYPASSDAEAAESSERAFRDEMAWHMRLYAQLQARRGQRAYLYYFTHEPPTDPGKRSLRATHTAEIPYVFNNLKPPRVYPDASSPELASASPRDVELADKISSYWINFARTGDPNGAGLAAWPAYKDRASGRAMTLGPTMAPEARPDTAMLDLYDALYRKQMTALRSTTGTSRTPPTGR
jgi:carboxylesterase type B